MIYLTAFYSILSVFAVVIELQHHAYVPAFCVALMSACALIAGQALSTGLRFGGPLQKLRRCILALIPLAVSLWLSHYRVHFQIIMVEGMVWVVVGVLVGFFRQSSHRR